LPNIFKLPNILKTEYSRQNMLCSTLPWLLRPPIRIRSGWIGHWSGQENRAHFTPMGRACQPCSNCSKRTFVR